MNIATGNKPMNRLQVNLQKRLQSNQKALITYIVAGDPEIEATVSAMHALVAGGADVIELGVPFSDPSAEGPVIQRAHERALAHRTSLKHIFAMVAAFRERDQQTAVVLMGYANPIEWMGYQTFAKKAADAGVDAALVVDIPPEESTYLNGYLAEQGLHNVFLLAPTSSEQRIIHTCEIANGFIYYVSLKGVTGSSNLNVDEVAERVMAIKQHSKVPVCVGFGIKDGDTAKAVAEYSDGVVVGSVLVQLMETVEERQALLQQLTDVVTEIRQALDSLKPSNLTSLNS